MVRTLFYYEDGHEVRNGEEYYHPHFTFSAKEAKQGTTFRVATMEDLNNSSGVYDVDEMYEGLFQAWNEETESPMIVRFQEVYEFDDSDNTYDLVDCEFRQATPKEIQSLSCDECVIRNECKNRVQIAS
ncbi:hypothetical protein [Inediibacterium massiliense]|uniref:hypothetical protein n=1 Tax=Inediibacterium massiliense TaxID=1658111 RepID=UPI0006B4C658|nr:hypothetical protein [Inediibacterium massiliense]